MADETDETTGAGAAACPSDAAQGADADADTASGDGAASLPYPADGVVRVGLVGRIRGPKKDG